MTNLIRSKDSTEVSGLFNSKKIVGNILSLGGGEIIARLVGFVGTVYLVRRLSPDGFGIICFATAICGYLSIGITAGFNSVGSREVARKPYEAATIALNVTVVRLALAVIFLAVIWIVTLLLNKPSTMKLVVILTGLSFLSLAFDTSWVYKGLEKSRRVGIALVLAQVIYVCSVLLMVKGPSDVIFVPLSMFLGQLVAATFLAVTVFRIGKNKLDIRKGMKVLKDSRFVIPMKLFGILIITFDIVMLSFFYGEREVGLYAAPHRFTFFLMAIVGAIHISYLPALTRAFAQGKNQIANILKQAIALSAFINAPLVSGGIILAEPLLRLLFGPEYLVSVNVLRLMILGMAFLFIHGTIINIFLVLDHTKIGMWITASSAGINIVLNLILIPSHGIIGAAFATLVARAFMLFVGVIAVYKIGIRFDFWPILRPAFAAGIMGAVLLGLGGIGSIGGLTLHLLMGGFVYIIVLVAFKGIPTDVQSYLHMFTQKLWNYGIRQNN